MIVMNGEIVAQGSQFSLRDVVLATEIGGLSRLRQTITSRLLF